VIGRTLARRQPRLRFGGHLFLQHLHETRFANAGFAAEQHHLPHAVLDLRPTFTQQRHFLLPAYQWGQANTPGRFQATAGHTLMQHLTDLYGLRQAFQHRCS
jgi:hypothetical protein